MERDEVLQRLRERLSQAEIQIRDLQKRATEQVRSQLLCYILADNMSGSFL